MNPRTTGPDFSKPSLRESGEDKDDVAVFHGSLWRGQTVGRRDFETERKLNRLYAKIRAIEKREGLDEFDEFIPEHPETPADWKALNGKSNRRYQEVEKIQRRPVHPLAASPR